MDNFLRDGWVEMRFKWMLAAVLSTSVWAGPQVGFFTPDAVPKELVKSLPIGMVNVYTPEHLAESLKRVAGTSMKLAPDFGPVLLQSANPSELSRDYSSADGQRKVKSLLPNAQGKILRVPTDVEIRRRFTPFVSLLAQYPDNVETIFLVDEPYLNGVSKKELERLGRVVRKMLDENDLSQIKLGVLFAGAMFDREFAEMIDRQSGGYVTAIDNYLKQGSLNNSAEFQQWRKTINKHRLATYDRAGNMYTGGGLPDGFTVISFDFYLSTLLLDSTHEQTLAWLSKRYAPCAQFAGQPMSKIRTQLSFFQNGPMQKGRQAADKKLLDAMFECRMSAITALLQAQPGAKKLQFLMFSEASNNGVLEFDANGQPKQGQPQQQVEARVLDEVVRAQKFYLRNAATYSAGLMYFTYENTYDRSLKLYIGGAAGMPSVLNHIFQWAGQPAAK
jgi:hypothetical protein